MKLKAISLTLGLLMGATQSFALSGNLSCQNNTFYVGQGGSLELTISDEGLPTHAIFSLNDPNPQLGGLRTSGYFDALAETYNEDSASVIYFKWYGGIGQGEYLNLIPKKMVIYNFADNYLNDKTVILGVIEWKMGQKVESHHVFNCL